MYTNQQLREEFNIFAQQLNPNFMLTLTTNKSWNAAAMKSLVGKFFRDLDRKLLGNAWLEKAIEEQNAEVDKLKEAKSKRISDKINVEGLTYNVAGECFLWEGLPFDSNQINTAAQLIAGMKIASMMLKDLKIPIYRPS